MSAALRLETPTVQVKCTHDETGINPKNQLARKCMTCAGRSDEAVCINCANTCHAGHTLGPVENMLMYCDCPSMGNCVLSKFKPKRADPNQDPAKQPSSVMSNYGGWCGTH